MRVGSKHICLKTRQSWCFTQGLRGHRHVVTDSLRSFSIISGTSDFPLPLHLVLNLLPNYRSRAPDQARTRKGQRETPHSGDASGAVRNYFASLGSKWLRSFLEAVRII